MDSAIGKAPAIPFVDALRVELTGRAHTQMLPPLVEMIKMDAFPAVPEFRDSDWEYHAFAQVGFKQTAPRDASEHVKAQAVRAICFHVFGPVEAELRLVQEDMWRLGVPSSSPAMQRVERLISVLRGDQRE